MTMHFISGQRKPLPSAAWCSALLLALAAHAQNAPAPRSGRLVLIDGSTIQIQSLEIRDDVLHGPGIPSDVMLDDVRTIELAAVKLNAALPESATVILTSGRIVARRVLIADEKCAIDWAGGEPLSLTIDVLRGICFDAALSDDVEKSLATPPADADRVLVRDEQGKLTHIPGLVDSLTADTLTLDVAGRQQRIARERIAAALFAQPAKPIADARCRITFRDGSHLGGQSLLLAGGKATLIQAASGQVAFPWSAVASVTVSSRRTVFLSNLKPVEELHQPIVTSPLPALRDKSAAGHPLRLGSRVYEKGLGVHARSSLTFAAEKKWDALVATIGLDPTAGSNGDCLFIVLADGERIFFRRLKGTDEPADINVPITGRQTVTLLVEPGENLDLADHANWCDARFIAHRRR
jgi:hypothetical protein